MNAFLIVSAVVFFLTVLNALFVAAEFALVGARRTRVSELAADGRRAARWVLPILENHTLLDRSIAAAQIGITLTSIIAGYVGQGVLGPVLAPALASIGFVGETAAAASATIIILLSITIFQVIFGELLPKSVALRFPEEVALATAGAMRVSLLLLRPFITVLNGSAFAIIRALKIPIDSTKTHIHTPEELEDLFQESARGGVIDAGEREMLHNIFTLDNRVVRQIMVPRVRVTAIEVNTPIDEAIKTLASSSNTRFPVYDETIDRILGTVHIRDLFLTSLNNPETTLRDVMRPVKLVPETSTVSEVWQEFKDNRTSMVMVFDEYGGISGLVTIEDIMEEIFGEMQDEFDLEIDLYREDEKGRIHLRGDMLISAANDRLLLTLPEDGPDTIGGLVVDILERTPIVGDEVTVQQVVLRVEAVDEYAATEVSLTPPGAFRGNSHPESTGEDT